MLLEIFLSALIISLISLIGVFFLSKKIKKGSKFIMILVAFAAGAMLGNVFFHILPESVEELDALVFSGLLMGGFLLFFVLEKVVHWRHCHDHHCDKHVKPVGTLNLIGDGVHNFLDGVLIAVSYLVSIPVGIATTIAIASHEIPQEIGDFSVLVYSGYSKGRALFFNFLSALLAVIGAVGGFFILKDFEFVHYVLPIVGGSLLYIATADLIPELHKENKVVQSIIFFVSLLAGLILLYVLKVIFEGH